MAYIVQSLSNKISSSDVGCGERVLLVIDGTLIALHFTYPIRTNMSRTSLTYGHPHMIDVHDCDARLPSSGDPNDLYMDELVRLSVLLGRVLKTIYR